MGEARDVKKQPSPSAREIFYFDAGRAYQTGVILSLMRVKQLTLEEFKIQCGLVLIRYLDTNRQDVILELYQAFIEGYDKGEAAKDEGLKVIPWGVA
jgi:hypothetical protein